MRLHRGALKPIKVSSFFVPAVPPEQSAQDSGILFTLDGDSRWIFLELETQAPQIVHSPCWSCSFWTGKRRHHQVLAGREGRHQGWAQGSCSGSEALQIPKSRQALSPPEPPAATCPKVSLAEHGLPFLCCAGPGQWSVGPLCKDRSQGKGKTPNFKRFVFILAFLGVFSQQQQQTSTGTQLKSQQTA